MNRPPSPEPPPGSVSKTDSTDTDPAGFHTSLILSDVTLREHGQNVQKQDLSEFSSEIRAKTALALVHAGFKRLEIISCVSPGVAPAMSVQLIKEIAHAVGRQPTVEIITLAPNPRGLKTFYEIGLGPKELNHTVGLFSSAVEAHNLENLGKTIHETRKDQEKMIREIHRQGSSFVAYITAAFGYRTPDPNSGIQTIDYASLRETVRWWLDRGALTVTLSDLQGVASPSQTSETFRRLLDDFSADALCGKPEIRIGYHPHHADTSKAVALVEHAYNAGIRLFDSSMHALGGCVTGGPGNVSTREVISLFSRKSVPTGIDPEKLGTAERLLTRKTNESTF